MDTNNYNINQRGLGSLDRGTKCARVVGTEITLTLYFQQMQEVIQFSCTITVGEHMIRVYKNNRTESSRLLHKAGSPFLMDPQKLEHHVSTFINTSSAGGAPCWHFWYVAGGATAIFQEGTETQKEYLLSMASWPVSTKLGFKPSYA